MGLVDIVDKLEVDSTSKASSLLSISPRLLDPEQEVRKMFGAKVVRINGNNL